MTVPDFIRYKAEGRKISVCTCYDASFARIAAATDMDCLLVGDSLSTVIYGYDTTIPATMALMTAHTAAVRRGAPEKMVVADMPFLSYRTGLKDAVENAGALLRAGANAVKLEGLSGNEEIIRYLTESGIPVMGHLGLTPQFYHAFGGNKVQGREEKAAERLLEHASAMEKAGCFSMVLECIPSPLAGKISRELTIPTIGIGAGPETDGQVLVIYDLLGLSGNFKAKFVRKYADGTALFTEALNQFHKDILSGEYPSEKESFSK